MQEAKLDFTSGGASVFFTELASFLEGLLQGTRSASVNNNSLIPPTPWLSSGLSLVRWMGYSYFFYGAYTENDESSSYQMKVAYWFVILVCFLLSLLAIVR